MKHAVEIRGLRKNFGDLEVLKGIDLDVAQGEAVVLLGCQWIRQKHALALY